MTTPSPATWTLRLKSRKTTVLLHVDPLSRFSVVKSHLLDALKDTGLRDPETGEDIVLPDSPSKIQLGQPVDIHDAQQGFKLGEWEQMQHNEEEEKSSKGKGKAKAKIGVEANGASPSSAKDCPKGAGLKDGTVLAFRWAGDGIWTGDSEDLEEDSMWGVKLASYEDTYGVQNEMDVGGRREFEG